MYKPPTQRPGTYSHGALGRGGRAAMSVHLPDVAAVPATLGEFEVRPELLFVPAVKDDFGDICSVFDSCDAWLANGPSLTATVGC